MTVDAHRRYSQELPCILTPAQQLLDDLRASKDEEELARDAPCPGDHRRGL